MNKTADRRLKIINAKKEENKKRKFPEVNRDNFIIKSGKLIELIKLWLEEIIKIKF